MKRQIHIIISLSGLLLLGCVEKPELQEEKAFKVRTIHLKEEVRSSHIEYLGYVDPQATKSYSFKSSGKIIDIRVNKGDKVKINQPLAVLENELALLNHEAATHQCKQAKEALDEAKGLHEKMQSAFDGGGISHSDLEKTRLDLKIKEANYDLALIDLTSREKMLRDFTIRSDINGTVLELPKKVGELTGSGELVVAVVSKRRKVSVGVSEEDMWKLKIGGKATVFCNGDTLWGKIAMISQYPDLQTFTFQVEVLIDADVSHKLNLGALVKVQFQVGDDTGIWIPIPVIQSDGEDFVYIIEKNRAVRRNITLRQIAGSQVKVEGLLPGDELITGGAEKLQEGSKVSPANI